MIMHVRDKRFDTNKGRLLPVGSILQQILALGDFQVFQESQSYSGTLDKPFSLDNICIGMIAKMLLVHLSEGRCGQNQHARLLTYLSQG